MQQFASMFGVTLTTTILDVGGGSSLWEFLCPFVPKVTLLNLDHEIAHDGLAFVKADGCLLPFADKSFDIVFCNSLIEHLYTSERQQALANEIRRVGKSYYVQTPNRHFPVEPHYLAPFIHWLPKRWRRRLLPFTPWALFTKPDNQEMDRVVDEILLLNAAGMRELFPQTHLIFERFIMVKSIIATNDQPPLFNV